MRCRSSLTWPKTKHEQLWLKKETWRRSRQIGRSELERIVASRTIIIYLFQHPPRSYWYIIIFVIPSNILSLILFEIRVQWGRLLSLSSTVRNLFASGSGPSGTSWTCRTTVRWVKKISLIFTNILYGKHCTRLAALEARNSACRNRMANPAIIPWC